MKQNSIKSSPRFTGLLTCAGLALCAGLMVLSANADAQTTQIAATPKVDELPATLTLNAVIRDFAAKGATHGHADFESYANSYITTGLIESTLDKDGKPVFKTKRGMQITTEYKDSSGRIINPSMYDASKGDKVGKVDVVGSDQLTSGDLFCQWYRDTANVNVSKVVPLVLNRVAGTSRYVFDSATDEPYKTRGGFFPINNDLLGNYSSTGKNFHFTTEINTKFVFHKADNLVFKFTGDDDVWVFINNKLVLDLGGLHSKKEQSVELNRIAGLTDNTSYMLSVFHAERHTSESNFRIETNIQLMPAQLPATTALMD